MTRDEMIKLDDTIIYSIGWWWEPDQYFTIAVGIDGVTKIDCREMYCGEYSIYWLQVWEGDKLVSRYNARNIDNIQYREQ